MPVPSKASARFWYWASAHPKQAGVKQATADEFVQSMHGQKLKNLPERVPQRKATGGAAHAYQRTTRW